MAEFTRTMVWEHVQRVFNITLGPCPFCGCPFPSLYMGPIAHVTCTVCKADGPTVEGHHELARYEACKLWNQRRQA